MGRLGQECTADEAKVQDELGYDNPQSLVIKDQGRYLEWYPEGERVSNEKSKAIG